MSSNNTNQDAGENEQITKIRKQLELYFSDLYIRWDKKMLALASTKGGPFRFNNWVPLKKLIEFPELSDWNVTVEQAAEAVSESVHLELNQDKDSVRRSAAPPPREALSNTIMVFNLSKPTTAQWLESAFGRFGRIYATTYLKYREARSPKGKGYVDFALEEAAQTAVNYFRGLAVKQIEADKFETLPVETNCDQLSEEEARYYDAQKQFHDFVDEKIKESVNQDGYDTELFKETEEKLKQEPLPEEEEQIFEQLHVILKADYKKYQTESGLFEDFPKPSSMNRNANARNNYRQSRRQDNGGAGGGGGYASKVKNLVNNLRQSFVPESVVKVTLHENNQNTRIGELKRLVRAEFQRENIDRETIVYLDMKGDNRNNPNIFVRCVDAAVAKKVASALAPVGESDVLTGDEHERYVNRACRALGKKYDYYGGSQYQRGRGGSAGRPSSRRPYRPNKFNQKSSSTHGNHHNNNNNNTHGGNGNNSNNNNNNSHSQPQSESEQEQAPRQTKVSNKPMSEPKVQNYEPGCIVKVEFVAKENSTLFSINNDFKAQLRELPYMTGVVYAGLDYGYIKNKQESQVGKKQRGYVRFDSAENAERFVKQPQLGNVGSGEILQGDEERDYIEQIMRIRQRKRSFGRRGKKFSARGGGRGGATSVRRRSARRSVDSD